MGVPARHPERLTVVNDVDDEPDPVEHSKLVLEAVRHLADQQQARAERTRSAARQMFVYVSVVFTVGQTVAFTSFGQANLVGGEQGWILKAGVVSAFALALTGVLAIITDRLRPVRDASVEDILDQADKAIDAKDFVGAYLTKLYADNAIARSKAVEDRQGWLTATTVSAVATVTLVLGEITISLISRIP